MFKPLFRWPIHCNKLIITPIQVLKFMKNRFSTGITPAPATTLPIENIDHKPLILDELQHNELRGNTEEPRFAWIENLSDSKTNKCGMITLHPDIFGMVPRIDLIHANVVWQDKYKNVNYQHDRLPCEMRGKGLGFGPKPWPQKGLGRARQGSRYAPQWVGGGIVHGLRKYMTSYYMLTYNHRVLGLVSTLSAKFIQDDLKIIDTLTLPSNEKSYLEGLVDERNWGPSVLFVDTSEEVDENFLRASEKIKHINVLPVHGLNVADMLRHETLVLTVAAMEKIQEKLIFNLHRPDFERAARRYLGND